MGGQAEMPMGVNKQHSIMHQGHMKQVEGARGVALSMYEYMHMHVHVQEGRQLSTEDGDASQFLHVDCRDRRQ